MHSNYLDSVSFYGLDVLNKDFKEVVSIIEEALKNNEKTFIATPNTEIIMDIKKNQSMKELLQSFDIVVPDGIGLINASRLKKKPLKERVTGADLSKALLEIANREGYSLYLLGGKEGIAEKASKNIIEKYPNIKIQGHYHGYFEEEFDIINKIDCDILFVGMGYPKQERFLYNHREKIKATVAIGNGGVLNILAGEQMRAPETFQRLGLEWLYRLIKEPSRIKRQWKLPLFLIDVMMDKNSVK